MNECLCVKMRFFFSYEFITQEIGKEIIFNFVCVNSVRFLCSDYVVYTIDATARRVLSGPKSLCLHFTFFSLSIFFSVPLLCAMLSIFLAFIVFV